MSIRLAYETNQNETLNQTPKSDSTKKVFPFPKKQIVDNEPTPSKPTPKPLALLKIDKVKKFSQKVLNIEGIEVFYPTTPHSAQLSYMESVIKTLKQKGNALLQAPAANGRTPLLCSLLAWLKAERESAQQKESSDNKEKIKIIYTSKSQSHLKHVVDELKATCYKPTISVMGSREQLCIREEFHGLKGIELESKCDQARSKHYKDHRCPYYDKLQTYQDRIVQTFQDSILDLEEVHTLGKKNGFCPFYYSQHIQQGADIVFIPYQTFLKKEMHTSMKRELKNAIVIFDEGHGVQAALEESVSFDLTSRLLLDCEIDINLLQDQLKLFPDESSTTLTELGHLSEVIRNLSKNFGKWRTKLQESEFKEKGKIWPGREVFKIFKELAMNRNGSAVSSQSQSQPRVKNPFAEGLDISNIAQFREILSAACEDLSDNKMNKNGLSCFRSIIDIIIPLMEDAATLDKRVPDKPDLQLVDCYDMYARVDPENSDNLIVSLWCNDPGIGFNCLKSLGPRSILINSATLMPMRSFEKNLRTRFETHFAASQVFDVESQCLTVVMKRGMNNVPLNFSAEKDTEAAVKDLGASLVNIARVVPHGILVLFASNDLMSQCMEQWAVSSAKESPILERLEGMKKIFKEDKYIQLTKHMVDDYQRHSKGRGAIFFATFQGRAFEELEFIDDMSRAVIVVGTPALPVETKRDELKRVYKESNALAKISAKDWSLQHMMRTVNQSFSKAIRHQNDFGVVILCDERFDLSSWNDLIVDWAKQNLMSVDDFSVGRQKIAQFLKERAIKPPAIRNLIQQPRELTPLKKTTSESKPTAKKPQNDSENEILDRLFNKFSNSPEKEPTGSALRQWDEGFKNNDSGPKKIVTPSDPEELSSRKSPPKRSNSPMLLESLSTRDTMQSSVKENLAENSLDSCFEDSRPAKSEKGKINSSLFHLINKKKESLSRREPLEPSKAKQIRELEQRNEMKNTFLKNFELDYDPQAIIEEMKEEPLPTTSKRFILNKRLFNLDTADSKTSETKPTESSDTGELMDILEEVKTGVKPKPRALPMPKPILRHLAPTQKDTQIGNNTSQGGLNSQKDTTTFLQQPYDVQNTSGLSCMICYEKGSDGRIMSSSKCGHIACHNCWEKWLQTKLECPMCKNKVRPKTLIKLGVPN